MWQQLRRFLIYQFKSLEFRFNTWKASRAIKRAYRDSSAFNRLAYFAGRHFRTAGIVCASLAVILLLCLFGPRIATSALNVLKSAPHVRAIRHFAHEQKMPPVKQPEPAVSQTATIANVVDTTNKSLTKDTIKTGDKSSDTSMNYCIFANKATRMVYLLSRDVHNGSWIVIERLPAVMGGNEGQKQTSGDKRTPEGTYFIVGRKEKAELNTLYGPLAYVLNYPNEEDRQAGRTGQGIWIHGMPEDSSRMVTRGCIVMQNTLLLTLASHIKFGVGTPVVIVDNKDIAEPQLYPNYALIAIKRKTILNEYVQREQEFIRMVADWSTAWSSRNISDYSRFYDAHRFHSSGMSWQAWHDRKAQIFESISKIDVTVDNIRLLDCSDSTAVVVFRQNYDAEQKHTQNAKRLCLYKNGNTWLIYREETFSTEEFLL